MVIPVTDAICNDGFLSLRKVQCEDGSLSDYAADINIATRLLGKAKDLAEPETGAFADLFRRKERLKDPLQVVRGYARACIMHLKSDKRARRTAMAPDRRHFPCAV